MSQGEIATASFGWPGNDIEEEGRTWNDMGENGGLIKSERLSMLRESETVIW